MRMVNSCFVVVVFLNIFSSWVNHTIWHIVDTHSRRRQWHPTPALLPGKSHGLRRLVGCSPWSRKESDTTERIHFHFSLSCTGEGNGNPLQCSCLENPRDGGAWCAAVYGVTQSRTQLKWLSSSSSSNKGPSSMPFTNLILIALSFSYVVLTRPWAIRKDL